MSEFTTTNEVLTGKSFTGFCDVLAPGVQFRDCRFNGEHPDHELLSTGPGTKIIGCNFFGHPKGQHRGIRVDSENVIISRTNVLDIKYDSDAQAIFGRSGTKNLLVEDSYLEAAGENILFGGDRAGSVDKIPTKIRIRRCTLSKPLTWRGMPNVSVKTLFELKNAIDVLLEHCHLQNCWKQQQVGYGIVLSPRNQYGDEPWSIVKKVKIQYNLCRYMAGGINLLGKDNEAVSERMHDVQLKYNDFQYLSDEQFGPDNGRQILLNGVDNFGVIGNKFAGDTLNSFLDLYGDPSHKFYAYYNYFQEGYYGIHGQDTDLGSPSLQAYCPGYVWHDNTVVKWNNGRFISYPIGTNVVGNFE